jgi:hypothetical protein
MDDIIVTTQAQYDIASGLTALYRNKPLFDIEADRGTGTAGEVKHLMFNSLYRNKNPDKNIDNLTFSHFPPEQARKIAGYHKEYFGDMFGTGHGSDKPAGAGQTGTVGLPRIIIRNNTEKISVNTDVEVSGYSYIEAFGNAHITARNNAYVIARDNVSVTACNKTRVNAFDKSCVEAYHNTVVLASGEAEVWAPHKSRVEAKDNTRVYARHNASVKSFDSTHTVSRDNALLVAQGGSTARVYDQSRVIARDHSTVFSHDVTEIHALNSSRINAYNYSRVVVKDEARVTANDDSLILTRDNTRAVIHNNARHISGRDNNADNLQENLMLVMKNPRFAGDPVSAARFLAPGVPPENKTAINRKYLAMGCNNGEETKRILTRWIKKRREDVSYER